MSKYIVDTGPIVAFLNANDYYHAWAKEQLSVIKPPLITCEAVFAEASFLLRKNSLANESLLEMLHRNLISISFDLNEEAFIIKKLMSRYQGVPMSLADACLVRMAEQHNQCIVITLDSDFHIYRKSNRQVISTNIPIQN